MDVLSHQELRPEPIRTAKFLADIPMSEALQPKDTIIMTGYLEGEGSEMYKVPAEIRVRMMEPGKGTVKSRPTRNPFPFPLPDVISTNLKIWPAWTGMEVEALLMPRMTETGEPVPASKIRRYSSPFTLKAQTDSMDKMFAVDVTIQPRRYHGGLMVYCRAQGPMPESTLFRFTTAELVERKMRLGEKEVIDGFVQWLEEEDGAREVPAKVEIECRRKSEADRHKRRVSSGNLESERKLTCSEQSWDSDSDNFVECGLLLDNRSRRVLAELTSDADPFYPIHTASSPLLYHLDPEPDTFIKRSRSPKPGLTLLPVDQLRDGQEEEEKPPQFRIETEEGLSYSVPLPSHICANTESLPKATTTSNPVNENVQALAQRIGFLLDNACEVRDRPDLVHPLVIVTQYATLQNPRQLHGVPVYEGTGTEALFLYINGDGEPAVRKGSFTYQANFDPYYLYLTPEAYGSGAKQHSHEILLIQVHNGKHLSSSERASSTAVAQEPTWLQGADGGDLPSPANAMASFLGVQEGDWDPDMPHVLACAEDDNASTSSSMPGLIAGSDDEGERVTTAEQEEDGDDFPACTETELIPITAQHIYTDSNPHPHLYADPRVLSGTSSISLARDVERHRWTTLAHSGGADVRARALEHLRRLGSNTREGRTTIDDILGALSGQRPYPPSMFISRILPVLESQNTPPSANPREELTRNPRRNEDYPVMQPSLLATVLGSFSDPQEPAPAYSPHPDTITMYVGMVLQAFRERFVRRDAPVSTILIQPSDPRVRQVMIAGPRRSEVVILNRNVAGFELVKKAIEVSPTFAAYGRGLEVLGTVGAVANAVRKSIMVMMRSGILPIPGYTPFPTHASPERMFQELLEGYTPVFPEEIPVAQFIYLVAHLLNEFVTGVMQTVRELESHQAPPPIPSPTPTTQEAPDPLTESINPRLSALSLEDTRGEPMNGLPPISTSGSQTSVLFTGWAEQEEMGWEGIMREERDTLEEDIFGSELSSLSEEDGENEWTDTSSSNSAYSPESASSESQDPDSSSSESEDDNSGTEPTLIIAPTPRLEPALLSPPPLLQFNDTPIAHSGSVASSLRADDGHELTRPWLQHHEEVTAKRRALRPRPFNSKTVIENASRHEQRPQSG
ncbi:hypothetical protein VKT23_013312 [Stygiomarasmius scandens]|uniref:Uncharacterized protein n=1 Tax=Marasmiellus scandens TaxID=2682957 RepID=A0ABR1J6E5_9AGAR